MPGQTVGNLDTKKGGAEDSGQSDKPFERLALMQALAFLKALLGCRGCLYWHLLGDLKETAMFSFVVA